MQWLTSSSSVKYLTENHVDPPLARGSRGPSSSTRLTSARPTRDDVIVGNVDKISAALMATFLTACIDGRRELFVEPFGRFVEIVAEVINDVPRKLDS